MDQERADYADPGAPPVPDVVRRLRVVGPGFIVGLCLSMCCGMATWPRHNPPRATAIFILLGPASGPFAEPLRTENYSLERMFGRGLILLALIAWHPYRPSWFSALVSTSALAMWFLLGLSNILTA
jgi:hypothetical protein